MTRATMNKVRYRVSPNMAPQHRALNKTRKYEYNVAGLEAEELIQSYLATVGDMVVSEELEDITQDIDCYFNGRSVSIKNQQAGLKYRNICLELATQHWQGYEWDEYPELKLNLFPEMARQSDRFAANPGTYRPGWGVWGKAEIMAIYRGTTLALYWKSDLWKYVQAHGFQRCRSLSAQTLKGQNGKDTVCGYLPDIAVKPYQVYDLANFTSTLKAG